MPVLSAAQLAYIRNVKADNYQDSAQIERDGALIAATQGCRLWPAWRHHAPQLLAVMQGLGERRTDNIVMSPDTADVAIGDTLTVGGQTSHVIGRGRWQTTIACAIQ